MIKQNTVLVATPIAEEATEKNISLHDKCGDIVKGLNETTVSIDGFTKDNIAVDLPEYTALVEDHTEVMEVVTDSLAASIRAALEGISLYVKPMLGEIEREIKRSIDPSSALDFIFNKIRIKTVNIEPEVFNSPFYPSKFPAGWDINSTVNSDDMIKGFWPDISKDKLYDFIHVDVKSLSPFFESKDEIHDVYVEYFVEKTIFNFFDGQGTVKFSNLENVSFLKFKRLMILSLMVNRFLAEDDPIEGVSNISLEDYRTVLSVTKNALECSLFMFKQIWEVKAKSGIAIISQDTKIIEEPDLPFGFLTGEIVVGYNNTILKMFAEQESLSFSEFIVGWAYAKARDYAVNDFITNKETIVSAFQEYLTDIKENLRVSKSKIGYDGAVVAINNLYNNTSFQPVIENIESSFAPANRMLESLSKHVDLKGFFGNQDLLDKIAKGECSLMDTVLSPTLCRIIGYGIAEEILMLNITPTKDSIKDQRKKLSESIDKIIVRRLMGS